MLGYNLGKNYVYVKIGLLIGRTLTVVVCSGYYDIPDRVKQVLEEKIYDAG
jgi:hypothetical protein